MDYKKMNKSINRPLSEKASNSTKLIRAAWRILKDDKRLIVISLIGYISSLLLLAGIATAAIVLLYKVPIGNYEINANSINNVTYLLLIVLLIAPVFIVYFIVYYFNGAIAYAALRRFDGEKINIKQALTAASKKSVAIFLFSCIQATIGITIGIVLQILENHVPLAGKIAAWLTGPAWNVAFMFSIPVIMTSNQKNPLKVVKKSATTFTAIWQESVFIELGLGIISLLFGLAFLIMSIAIAIGYAAITLNSLTIGITGIVFVAIIVSAYALIISTLQTVLITAAYHYATTNKLPAGFDEELIRKMFRPNKKWLA